MRKQSTAIEVLDLQLFTSVVEHRSFSAAARAHGTATPAASKRVARLESLLGARLLERTTRRVLPTDAGAAFYARATRILSDLGDAENEVATLGGKPRGTLRVSAPLLLGERHLVPLLTEFFAKYPDIRVEVVVSDTFVNLLADRFDVALRVGPLVDASLVRVRVGDTPAIVVAAPSYLKRMGTPETPRDLARHNCLRFSNLTATQEWRFKSARGKQHSMTVPTVGNLMINHGGGLREAAIAGIGIARLPDFLIANELANGKLVRLLRSYEAEPTGIHLVYPAGGKPLPKVEVFVKEISAALKARLRSLRHAE